MATDSLCTFFQTKYNAENLIVTLATLMVGTISYNNACEVSFAELFFFSVTLIIILEGRNHLARTVFIIYTRSHGFKGDRFNPLFAC